VNELVREFEPTAETICQWIKQAGLGDGLRSDGLTTSECEELYRLRSENLVEVEQGLFSSKWDRKSGSAPASGATESKKRFVSSCNKG